MAYFYHSQILLCRFYYTFKYVEVKVLFKVKNMKQILIIGFLIIMMISGCSVQKVQEKTLISSEEIGNDVSISDFAFNPRTITIQKGESIIWTNEDSVKHSIVSDSGNEIASDSISKGEIYEHTFNNVGTYSYYCGIHPSMKGEVVVE